MENLPRPLTSFVGRDREIEAVLSMLNRPDVRLLTLTGPGGIGKTRLAIEVSRLETPPVYPMWFVPLASVREMSLVSPAIARAVSVRRITDRSAEQEVIAVLGQVRGLLILDNVEQLSNVGILVSTLLRNCPELKVLVTSRSRLGVSGEHIFTVPPMTVPNPGEHLSPSEVQDIETVRLFVDRAQAGSSTFALTPQHALAIAAICRQLDGLPLAIELAAARIGVFSPTTLREWLGERLTLLADGPRDEPPRLRSMRDSIAWSYDLLGADEKSVFAQLAVFAGPWTLEAAEAIVRTGVNPAHESVLEYVSVLVRNNLVRQDTTSGGRSIYSMLETIRQFAKELLDRRDDVEGIRNRHTEYIRGNAQQAEVALYRNDGAHVFDRLRVHLADILQVLARLEHDGDVDTLIDISSDLRVFWGMQGHVFEGRPWLERAVELGRASDSPNLGKAIVALGGLIHMQGNETAAWEYAREGLALLRRHDNDMARFIALTTIGLIALRLGEFERAASLQKEALTVISSMPPAQWATCAESTILGHLGNIAVSQGEIEAAGEYFNQALERQTAMGFERGTSHFMASHPIAGLGDVARADDDLSTALKLYQEALSIAHRNHDLRATLYALGGVAGSLAATGEWTTAATLFGAGEHHHARVGIHFDLETLDRQRALGLPEPWLRAGESFRANQQLRDVIVARNLLALPPVSDPDAAAKLWSAGRELALDDAVSLALAAEPGALPAAASSRLSFRELEVLRLLVQGKTDAEIASLLFISRRTASTHVRHIYEKLDVSSRAGATAYALRHGLA